MPAHVTVVGLGPGDFDQVSPEVVEHLADPSTPVILRTRRHPAAEELAARRPVETCDDLYEGAATFDEVYRRIVDRVLQRATDGPVIYAVPGSPLVAERSVAEIRRRARAAGWGVEVVPAPSFLDAAFLALEFDPAARGFQLLDGRDLPEVLTLQLPTIIFHVDLPMILADVVDRLGRVLPDGTPVTLLTDLGTRRAAVTEVPLHAVEPGAAGLRTSLFVDPPPVGYVGAVAAMRRLRVECPWDREQTHDSLVPFALEEVHELLEALAALPPGAPDVEDVDYGAYAEVEDELGDVLLQVIFHANLATEAGAFDIEDVAEQLRRKLVRRHPHVFGDVEVSGAEEVVRNWQAIKAGERDQGSLMDGVPSGMSSLARAAKVQQRAARVGFDWPAVEPVIAKVAEEVDELRRAPDGDRAAAELGDLLFATVNVARHLGVEPDVVLRRATQRFERRFRMMEDEGPLEGLSLDELNARWERAKVAGG